VCSGDGVNRAGPTITQHNAGNGAVLDSDINMVTDNTPVLETYWTAQGRKRTSFKHELLHYINAGETALARFLRGYVTHYVNLNISHVM
jgi:hypothetical protein